VTFHAEPPHPVTKLVFDGEPGLLREDLERRVLDHYNGMPVGVPPELVKDAVLVILDDHGYPGATATVRRDTSSDPDRSTLTFEISAGPLARVGKIKIENPNQAAVTNARILTFTGLGEGEPYRKGPLDDSIQELVGQLKSRGYYTAAGFAHGTRSANGAFDVDVTMSPGPLIVLEWDRTGDTPPDGDINDFIPIKAQNSIDQDLLDDSCRRIEVRLSNEGYADAKAVILRGEDTPERRVLKVRITRGPLYRVDHVELPGNLNLSTKEILTLLQVNAGDDYREPHVFAGLLQIRLEYYRRGFYKAMVLLPDRVLAPGRPSTDKEKWVIVRPQITEGPRGRIVDIVFDRTTTQMPETTLLNAMQGTGGQPYIASQNLTDSIRLEATYLDHGYRNAKVRIEPKFDANGADVQRIVHIDEGVQVRVADVQIIGWHDISERAIREEMSLRPGDAFSEAKRLESQTRLYNMGVFKQVTVDIDPDNPLLPTDTNAHVLVRVVEAPDTTIAFGAGVEAGRVRRLAIGGVYEDRLEFAPSGSFEISRRNLGGRNRAIDLATRVSLRPRDVPDDPLLDGRGYRFSEYRAAIGYRERRAFRSDTDWLFSATSEQANRTTFNFIRHAANVEFLRRLSLRSTANARYTIEFTRLFDTRFIAGDEDDALDIDRVFPQVRISSVSLSLLTDHRDEAVAPKRGMLLSIDGEVAARAIGSEVGFIKTFMQGSTYRRLAPRSDRFVLAARVMLGLAHGFERSAIDDTGLPIVIEDLPASERFFSGGSNTVRGFQRDRLGTPEVLTLSGLSVGGNGLVVLNAELRTIVGNLFKRRFSVVEFVDSGNVWAKASDIRLRELRTSVGFGIRYDSPLGPLRLDFGRKVDRLSFNGFQERAWEYHLSFGEVF
jgi:outer membrane protein assembly complex protein YaeT